MKPIKAWCATYYGGRQLNPYYVRRTKGEVMAALAEQGWTSADMRRTNMQILRVEVTALSPSRTSEGESA